MSKKRIPLNLLVLTAVFLSVSSIANAQEGDICPDRSVWELKHEVYVGVGDMLFETLMWHDELQPVSPSGNPVQRVKSGYSYTPHIAAGYAYHLKTWLSLGISANFQMTMWNGDQNFFNLCIMPEIKFTYFRRENVGLYSALATGIDINGGTEKNIWEQNTELGAALDLRLFGVTAGKGHWWGFLDIGGLYALQSNTRMYMLNSNMVRAGLSYKF